MAYLNHHEQTGGRNMDIQESGGEDSEVSEEHVYLRKFFFT